MIHSFNPSEVYFSATLENHKTLFPGSFKLLHPLQQDNHAPTMIAMNTPTGTFRLPSHYPRHQKENITLHSVNLTICLESLQFAESPFIQWKPVETHNGSLHFPNTQSILAALPVVQHHPPPNHMFKNPQVKHLRWTQRQVLDPLLERQFLPQTQQLTRRGFQNLPSNIPFDIHMPEFNPPTVRTEQFNNSYESEQNTQFHQHVPAPPTQNLSAAYPDTVPRMNNILDHRLKSSDYRSAEISEITTKLKSMQVPVTQTGQLDDSWNSIQPTKSKVPVQRNDQLDDSWNSIHTTRLNTTELQNDQLNNSWHSLQTRLDTLREPPRVEIQPDTRPAPPANNIADTVFSQRYQVPPARPRHAFYRGTVTPSQVKQPAYSHSAPHISFPTPPSDHSHRSPNSQSSQPLSSRNSTSVDLISTNIPQFNTSAAMDAVLKDQLSTESISVLGAAALPTALSPDIMNNHSHITDGEQNTNDPFPNYEPNNPRKIPIQFQQAEAQILDVQRPSRKVRAMAPVQPQQDHAPIQGDDAHASDFIPDFIPAVDNVVAHSPNSINNDNFSNQTVSDGSRQHLMSLIPLLESYPTTSNFSSFKQRDLSYILPHNLETFMGGLIAKINDHTYPDIFADKLAPYVLYDQQLRQYRYHNINLTLPILQKLDHVASKTIPLPNPLKILKNIIQKQRSRSRSK